jgi:hypothetical protein
MHPWREQMKNAKREKRTWFPSSARGGLDHGTGEKPPDDTLCMYVCTSKKRREEKEGLRDFLRQSEASKLSVRQVRLGRSFFCGLSLFFLYL